MLEIRNLHAGPQGKEILQGVNLTIEKGEVHALMGPNGSGKSTLAAVLSGHPLYTVSRGDILFYGKSLLSMEPEERAHAGLFLAFQYPVEIPGLSIMTFLQNAVNAVRKSRKEAEFSALDFVKYVKEKAKYLDIGNDFLGRAVNEGFSGGEKKRHEILQLLALNPRLAILDETDSGLDIDALQVVSSGINHFRSKENALVVITHYERILRYIIPDKVSILYQGQVVMSGNKDLAKRLEAEGYNGLLHARVLGSEKTV